MFWKKYNVTILCRVIDFCGKFHTDTINQTVFGKEFVKLVWGKWKLFRASLSRQTQGYSCIIIAMWTAARSMACSSPCLIMRTGYRHLGRIFSEEYERLREVFRKLRYLNHLIDSVINRFITSRVAVDQPKRHMDGAIQIVLPYKDQVPVVQRLDNAIHRINHYPPNGVVWFVNTYPLDSDLSGE